MTCYLLYIFATFLLLINSEAFESNFVTVNYEVEVKKPYCYQVSGYRCYRCWWWRTRCHHWQHRNCVDRYEKETRSREICKEGWSGSLCNIPICNSPRCQGGKVCVRPNVCECLNPSGVCTSVPCGDTNNCYPGTCDTRRNTCQCPAGFSGPNCQSINRLPDIKSCTATIFPGSPEVAVTHVLCPNPGETMEPKWINVINPSSVTVKWRVEYNDPLNVPNRNNAPHVDNAPAVLGVHRSYFKTSFGSRTFSCSIAKGSNNNPPQFQDCERSEMWSEISANLPQHNNTMQITVSAALGGYKVGSKNAHKGSQFNTQDFVGDEYSTTISLKFDSKPPQHCLSTRVLKSEADDCDSFPIYVANDTSTKSRFDVFFYNWTDAESGIEGYHIEVYFMQVGEDELLHNIGKPVIEGKKDPDDPSFSFNLRTPGVYAIELTVEDRAGNKARARKIIFYDENSKVMTDDKKPIKLSSASSSAVTSGQWINKLKQDGEYVKLDLDWTGHFSSNPRYSSGWASEVATWSSGIDDRYGDKYGERSIDKMAVSPEGIYVYNLAYAVDKNGGHGVSTENRTWVTLNSTDARYTLSLANISDGDSLVVWINANDLAGSGTDLVEESVFHVDRTRPEYTGATRFEQNSPDEFMSRVHVSVRDRESGIERIDFKILDMSTGGEPVKEGTSLPVVRDHPDTHRRRKKRGASSVLIPCISNDDSCYCTPQKRCYSTVQEISIDHCWIDRLAGHNFKIKYTVFNNAGLQTSEKESKMGEGPLNNIPCRPSKMTGGAIAAMVIGLLLGAAILAALIFIIVTVLRVKVYHKPQPEFVKRLQSFRHKENRNTDNELYLATDDIQHIVKPGNAKAAGLSSNQGASRSKQAVAFSNLQKNDTDDFPPPYTESSTPKQSYGAQSSKGNSNFQTFDQISNSELEYGKQIGKGRFATISKAQVLLKRGYNCTAAAKRLRSGHDDSDTELMKRKINYLKHMVPPHQNIVRYLGETTEPEKGTPVLLLEYCELNLLEWLKSLKCIDSEVESQLVAICLGIARGMEHLHKNNIIHMRLAARNVLLSKSGDDYVAKLIGFGPMSEKRMKESPIEWFAPETIETVKQEPVHNRKTDAWSYGIVLWEIFSKGESPYPGVSRANLLNHLKSGGRMKRPLDMSQEIYEDVVKPCWQDDPKRRPDFGEICQSVISYRDGMEQPLYRCDDDRHDDDAAQDIYANAGQEIYANV